MINLVPEPIVISLEEFEKVIIDSSLLKDKVLSITPVLQVWDDTISGYYRATGYLVVAGVFERDFWVASYSSEGVRWENADYEQDKFLELIELSFVEPLVKRGWRDKDIVISDVILK